MEAVQYLEGGGGVRRPRWRLSVVEESRLWLVNIVSLRRSLRTRVYSRAHDDTQAEIQNLYARSFHRDPTLPNPLKLTTHEESRTRGWEFFSSFAGLTG